MGKTKYGKYIITDTEEPAEYPRTKDSSQFNTIYIHDELKGTIKNAFYMQTNMVRREYSIWVKPHNHSFDEYLVFLGTNADDPSDLGGEVELWLGGEERHIITKTAAVFIPRGMHHCPLKFTRVDRPIIFITTGNTNEYTHLGYSADPKWSHLPEFPSPAESDTIH